MQAELFLPDNQAEQAGQQYSGVLGFFTRLFGGLGHREQGTRDPKGCTTLAPAPTSTTRPRLKLSPPPACCSPNSRMFLLRRPAGIMFRLVLCNKCSFPGSVA